MKTIWRRSIRVCSKYHNSFIKCPYNKSMEKTNVLFLLTPKTQLACLKDSMNVRQALEKMRAHGFTAGGPSVFFLTRDDGEVSEPLVGRQGSRVSMRVARGSASLLPSHGRGIWPRDVLKKVSRGLSRVEAGNSGFPRLVQVTSGGFSWWL